MIYVIWIILAIIILKISVWFGLKAALDKDFIADEVHTIRCNDGWRINLYRRFNHKAPGEPILICHGIMGNPTNFLYPEGHAMVDTLVEQGYDCWLIDLRGNRHCSPPLGTSRYTATYDDYYMRDLPAAIDHIRTKTGSPSVHWIGHSMGGMLLYTYATVHGTEALASGTTLGTPPGFDDLNQKPMPLVMALLTLCPALADPWIRALASLGPIVKISASFAPINWKNIATNINFFSTTEYAPPAVTQQMHDWASTNSWVLKEADIDIMDALPKLDFPLHVLAGSLDPLASLTTIEKFHAGLTHKDTRFTPLGKKYGCEHEYNHVDLVFSTHGREEVYLPIVDWLRSHPIEAPKKKRAPRKKTAVKKKKAAPKAKAKAKGTK